MPERDARLKPGDDEAGRVMWKVPEEGVPHEEEEEDDTDADSDFDIPPLPSTQEVGIHAPEFDPVLQQEWVEQKHREQIEEEERKRREDPRGYVEL